MDEETRARIASLQAQVNVMALFVGQLLAAITADDPAKRDLLDEGITRFAGMVGTAGGAHVMDRIRTGADKMLSVARRDEETPPT